jgi:hypothetical protein
MTNNILHIIGARHALVHAQNLNMSNGERVGHNIAKVMVISNQHGDLQLDY